MVVTRDLVLLLVGLAALSGCDGGGGGGSQASGAGSASPARITVEASNAAEESRDLRFRVLAAFQGAAGPSSARIEYTIEGETAQPEDDFKPSSGVIKIERKARQGPEVEHWIEVTLEDDIVDEEDETLRIVLSKPTNAVLAISKAAGRIIDNDPEPSLAVGNAQLQEIGGAPAVIVRLSAPSEREIRVSYSTRDGSARAGRDYRGVSGKVTFAPGEREKEIPVGILDDTTHEGEEDFFLRLSSPVNATLEQAEGRAVITDIEDNDSGIDERPSNSGCTFPEKPLRGGAEFAPVFTGLWRSSHLVEVVDLLQAPGDPSRWFAVDRRGRVVTFANDVSVDTARVFLDIRSRVLLQKESGLLGMALHPRFPSTPHAFLFYTAPGPPLETRISRFHSQDGGATLSASTEEVLIRLPQENDFHKGGHLAFGPDGYLYAGLGDDGSSRSAQDVNVLTGKLVRIDVDAGSPYGIPPSNPFSGGGGRPELYAWGFRNPWRWSFDRLTGELWLGDVGEEGYEEIDRVQLGGNYGWPVREGRHCVEPGCSTSGLVDPFYEWSQEEDGARAAIGGYVYRGSAVPELQGMYIFGDWGLRKVWALPPEGGRPPLLLGDLSEGVLLSFAEDVDGEVYALIGGRRIFKTAPAQGESGDVLPSNLSDLPCVNPSDPRLPAPWLIPYDLNVPFWSDGAVKERWFAVPDGARISIGEDGDWDLPPGSVTMKTFRLDGRLVETRLMVRQGDGEWAGYSYEWNSSQTDAKLLTSGKTQTVGNRTWKFPSRGECLQCHTDAAGGTLGLETGQLNREFRYPSTGRTRNQLATFDSIGLLASSLPAPPEHLTSFPPIEDETAPLGDRARAYLHVNCSHCHRPGGTTRGSADFRFQVPFAATGLCNGAPAEPDADFPGAILLAPGEPARSLILLRMTAANSRHMPPIGAQMVDVEGVALLERWIASLGGCR